MKKQYITPAFGNTIIEMNVAALQVTASDQGIGYGGEDDGTHDPDAKQRFGKSVLDDNSNSSKGVW